MATDLSSTDQVVVDLLRNEGPLSVNDMVDNLGVTATAVRQRLSRLMAHGLIDRIDFRKGRGRPVHKYSLTESGVEAAGDNLADLARALWLEISNIADTEIRRSVIAGVVRRLVSTYRDQISGETLDERMKSIADLFGLRSIPFVFEHQNGQPVLKIIGCSYPHLNNDDESQHAAICELERQLLSELSDHPLDVDRCACQQGGNCCTFHASDAGQS